MEAATAMDFQTLSRRELQALCKRNGIRANMTNVAMADALQGLTSVDGIDEIGTTLCLPTPGRSAMKSAAKVVAVEEQQHGSPLPRGRRVSVKSPEAIRMEVEGGEEDGVKEIVKTPGVALRSTRRGTRATPAPLPTPAPAGSTRATARRTAARKTIEVVPTPVTRRSQRTASRKAEGAVEADRPAEDVPEEKTSKMTIALEQEAEVVAAASKEEKVQEDEPKAPALSDEKFDGPNEEKVQVQQEEPKAVASDVKCDDTEEEEVVNLLDGGNKEKELVEGEEADSSDATTESAAVFVETCNDPKLEEVVVVMEEQSTKPHEGIVKGEEPISVEGSAPLTVMDDSPIRGVIEKEQDVSVEMTDEIIPVIEDKEVAIIEEAFTEDKEVATNEEAVEEDSFANTAAGEDETIEEGEFILTEVKEGADDEMPQAGETTEEDHQDYLIELNQGAADKVTQPELALEDNETSEEDEDDLSEESEVADVKMLQGLTDNETTEEEEWASDDDDESIEKNCPRNGIQMLQGTGMAEETKEDADDLSEESEVAHVQMLGLTDNETSEEEEWASDDDENTEEIDSTGESDEDTDESNDKSYPRNAIQMLQGTGMAEEAKEDAFSEDDDFSGDLPPEFDNIMISDAETESDIAPQVLQENQAAMNAKKEEGPEEADATEKAPKEVDNIVKSLDEFTLKEGESEEMQKKQTQDYTSMSLRKLKSTYKNRLIAVKEGMQEEVTEAKRLPLEEVDENAGINH